MDYNLEQTLLFEDDGKIPNSSLPLLVYPKVVKNDLNNIQRTFHRHNWKNSWIGGVYSYHHFHSNSHEVLGVVSGNATIKFGGEQGLNLRVTAGDVVIIPAGVGHKHIESSDNFAVIGAYPNGKNCDLKIGDPSEHSEVLQNISKVPLPKKDPIFGNEGPLKDNWGPED